MSRVGGHNMRQNSRGGVIIGAAFRGATVGAAIFSILSCSDATAPGNDQTGKDAAGLTAEDYRAPVAAVAVSLAQSSISVGQTTQATATLYDSRNRVLNRSVTWSSSDPAVATVSASGLVTGLKAGTTSIIASRGTKSGSAALTVTDISSTGIASVASVTISPATATITVGQTQALTTTLRDSSGNVLTGRTVAWTSSNSSVETVTGSGTVTGVAQGTATITATSEGVNGTASITVNPIPPPPPPPGSGPEPAIGDVILVQNSFDAATLTDQLVGYATAGSISRVTDGHSGAAVRFSYSPGNDDNLIEKTFPVMQDGYYRFYFRTSPGALPYSGRTGSGIKWFMPWRAVGYRYTMGVGMLVSPAWQFTSHDNTSTQQPNPFGQNISQTPRFDTVNDGQWHEYTLHIKTTSPAGEQIWIDGILVLDDFAQGYDHSPEGISMVQFPGLVVDGIPDAAHSFTIDIDDFVIWHR